MKKTLFLTILFFAILKGNAQNKFYDYIVTESDDTIYGTIQTDGLNKKVLYQKNNSNKSNGIKFYCHKLKSIKKFQYNFELYNYEEPSYVDPIYEEKITPDSIYYTKTIGDFVNKSLILDDYIVTLINDTIYGKIKKPLMGKKYLIDDFRKHKIAVEKVKSYRFKNEIYFNLSHIKKKYKFLKLVVDGSTKLYYDGDYKKSYGLGINSPTVGVTISGAYYIQKGNEFVRVSRLKYKKQMIQLFSENKLLISKIRDGEFTYENMILIVKFYNES